MKELQEKWLNGKVDNMAYISALHNRIETLESIINKSVYCIWKKTLAPMGVMYVCSCNESFGLFRRYEVHDRCPCCHKLIQYVGLNGKVIE